MIILFFQQKLSEYRALPFAKPIILFKSKLLSIQTGIIFIRVKQMSCNFGITEVLTTESGADPGICQGVVTFFNFCY